MMTDPYGFLSRSKIQLKYNTRIFAETIHSLFRFLLRFGFHACLLVVQAADYMILFRL